MVRNEPTAPAFFAFPEGSGDTVPLQAFRHPGTGHQVYWVRADASIAASMGYVPDGSEAPLHVHDRPAPGDVPLYVYVKDPSAVFGKPLMAEVPQPDRKGVSFHTLRGRLLSDQTTDNDLLGYSVYATAIAELIRTNAEETGPDAGTPPGTPAPARTTKLGMPFNIGIIAPWGHGKTTLMKQVQQELDPKYWQRDLRKQAEIRRTDNEPADKKTLYADLIGYLRGKDLSNKQTVTDPFPSVWFNAWRYQSSNQIWAGLGHAIITDLSARLPALEREKFWLKLQLGRVDVQKVRLTLYADLVKKLIPWLIGTGLATIAAILVFAFNVPEKGFSLLAPLITAALTAVKAFGLTRQQVDGKVSVFLNEPDYSGNLGVYHGIIEDLHKVFSLLLREDQRAVVFIDDLDRCSPNVIGEVFEAVNLMMVDPIIGRSCYFIFGMDAQVVAAALDQKYAMMAGKLREQEESFGSVGWYFLDKFIQLPFNVPIMSGDERLHFLSHYFRPDEPVPTAAAAQQLEQTKAEVGAAMREPDAEKQQERLSGILNNPVLQTGVKEEAVKAAVKEKLRESDSGEIMEQLRFISPFLSSSPREIIRYINLLRFFNSALFVRQSMEGAPEPVAFKGVAKYLLLALKWPQLVRWIQWEGEEDLVLYNTTRDKAVFLDGIIREFGKANGALMAQCYELKEGGSRSDGLQQLTKQLHEQWCRHIDALVNGTVKEGGAKKLPWLYDKQMMEVLIHQDTADATFEKALQSKMW